MGTVVVAHGLWMPRASMWLVRRRLEAAGFRVVLFGYASVAAGLDENARRLASFAGALEPAAPVHFVGHSLGGTIIVRMLERDGPGLVRPGRVVCLGSPLVGCHGGRVLLRRRWGRPVVGRSIADLVEAGGLDPWPGVCDLGILAGDAPLGFGRLLGGLPRPNDGTVAVEETRLPGADAHRVLHVTHAAFMWSTGVAAEIVRFLRTGRFSAQEPTSALSS